MKKVNILILFILLFFRTPILFSQDGFSIHSGISVPFFAFANDNLYNSEAGGAGIGFMLGMQFVHPIKEKQIGLFGSVDFCYNGLKRSVKNAIKNFYVSPGFDDTHMTYWKYINIPISAGLNFTVSTEYGFKFLGDIGITANILKLTDFNFNLNGDEYKTRFDLAGNIGFKIGAGFLINDKFIIQINYLGLGEHSISGQTIYQGVSEDLRWGSQKVYILTLSIGVRF